MSKMDFLYSRTSCGSHLLPSSLCALADILGLLPRTQPTLASVGCGGGRLGKSGLLQLSDQVHLRAMTSQPLQLCWPPVGLTAPIPYHPLHSHFCHRGQALTLLLPRSFPEEGGQSRTLKAGPGRS